MLNKTSVQKYGDFCNFWTIFKLDNNFNPNTMYVGNAAINVYKKSSQQDEWPTQPTMVLDDCLSNTLLNDHGYTGTLFKDNCISFGECSCESQLFDGPAGTCYKLDIVVDVLDEFTDDPISHIEKNLTEYCIAGTNTYDPKCYFPEATSENYNLHINKKTGHISIGLDVYNSDYDSTEIDKNTVCRAEIVAYAITDDPWGYVPAYHEITGPISFDSHGIGDFHIECNFKDIISNVPSQNINAWQIDVKLITSIVDEDGHILDVECSDFSEGDHHISCIYDVYDVDGNRLTSEEIVTLRNHEYKTIETEEPESEGVFSIIDVGE